MGKSFYFISYSPHDGKNYAIDLADQLVGGPPSIPVWLAARNIQPGIDRDAQIVQALGGCVGVLYVMTAESVSSQCECHQEWTRALKYKKTVIPLLFNTSVELPFRLEPREIVEFIDFERGLARLRSHLSWRETQEGVLCSLRERLIDANRDLARTVPTDRSRVEDDIAELQRQIAELQQAIDNPAAAQQRTQRSIQAGLERERQPAKPAADEARTRFINRPPMQPPAYFQDRHVETRLIVNFLKDESLRLMTVIGRGGAGKTAMVCRLLRALESGRLPDDGGPPFTIDGIVYLSARAGHPVNFANLFADLCKLLPEAKARQLDQFYRDGPQSVTAQMRTLLAEFPPGRAIVLLDHFEDVIDAETQAINQPDLDEALRTALDAPPHGVKFLMTTNVAPRTLLLTEPGLQSTLRLKHGLQEPYAEQVLKEMDVDGQLGLHETDAPLSEARIATRGCPRALEAIVGILRADHNTTLPDVLRELQQLHPKAENIVNVLVGEAFNRLDPTAQEIMQALAVYRTPVPAVAVDYLLQPYRADIDSAPVLSRLVNMQFVRSEVGYFQVRRFHLHLTDRDYALSRISPGTSEDRAAQPPSFTLYALRYRAAEYFKETRKPREAWKALDDLAPQLAEFDVRIDGEEYDAAARVLLDIDFDYLMLRGHSRLTAQMHERLQGHLTDRELMARSLSSLGSCHYNLGEYLRAIDLFQQSLTIAREIGNSLRESVALCNLGSCCYSLGDYHFAIDNLQRSLEIARKIGNSHTERIALSSLGNCYYSLGDYHRAIDNLQQSLEIARGIKYRQGEGCTLGNLGNCYRSLGDYHRAIQYLQRYLEIAREIGYRYGECSSLANLGVTYTDLGELEKASEHFQQSHKTADKTGNRQNQNEALFGLALVRLYESNLAAARDAIDGARRSEYPENIAAAWATTGTIHLRQGESATAREAFASAVREADRLLALCEQNVAAQDTKGLALCGLALCKDGRHLAAAEAAFEAARQITKAKGVVTALLNQFDALALADAKGILAPVRKAAAGE